MLTDKSMRASSLAKELAERLDAFVPDGFTVTVRSNNIRIADGKYWAEIALAEILKVFDEGAVRQVGTDDLSWASTDHPHVEIGRDDSDAKDRLEAAVLATLSGVQDFVIAVTRAMWPPPRLSDGESSLPLPGVKIGKVLELWYGLLDSPVLEFDPITYTSA